MNTYYKYSWLCIFALLLQSCVKDMQDDINNGGWNHERTILGLTLKNQVGVAEVENTDGTTGKVTVTLNTGAIPDLSKVEIEALELSYQATASVGKGGTLDFNNAGRTASLTVTSATGKTREYTIQAAELEEAITGTWAINNLIVYGGTGPEYGGGGVLPLAEKPWCWSETYGPEAELDNTITFIFDGITDDGNTTGICINDAGPDGKYADFIFQGSQNKDHEGTDLDLKHFYRQIPEGESRWVRNYAAGTISFTDAAGKVTTAVLEEPGTYKLGDGHSITLESAAFSFVLSGQDDWDNIYTDFDKFAKKPRNYYIVVTRQ